MTTQAVTPAAAAAGLGLLMHPNMLMMHQMTAMANHVNQGLSPQMQMLQQMQQMSHPQMNHLQPPTSVAQSHPASFPKSLISPITSVAHGLPHTARQASPSQIVPTNPLITAGTRAALDSIGAQSSNNHDSSFEEVVEPGPVDATPIIEEIKDISTAEIEQPEGTPEVEKIETSSKTSSVFEKKGEDEIDQSVPTPNTSKPASPVKPGTLPLRVPSRSVSPGSKAPTPHSTSTPKASPLPPIAAPIAVSTPSLLHPALHGMAGLNTPLGSLLGASAGQPAASGLNLQHQLLLAQQQLVQQQSQQAQQAQIQQLQQALAISMASQMSPFGLQAAPNSLQSPTANPAAQQAQNILAAVQAQALQQRAGLNQAALGQALGGLGTTVPEAFPAAKASAQQAVSAAEKMYRDALQARQATLGGFGQLSGAAPIGAGQTSSDILKQLNLLRAAQK